MSCTASRHGTDTPGPGEIRWLTAYTKYDCRCPEAARAARRYQKRWRMTQHRDEQRLLPCCGAVLRLRALQGIGHSLRDLARMLGYAGPGALGPLVYGQRQRISQQRHERVKELYDRLWNTPGSSDRARAHAARQRWPLPLDLDDDLIDDPAYEPVDNRLDDVTLRRQQRAATNERIAELEARGMSARQIAAEVGVSTRLVVRRRAVARREAA
jgi:uncharacterized protein YoaH (UPF0181 family)